MLVDQRKHSKAVKQDRSKQVHGSVSQIDCCVSESGTSAGCCALCCLYQIDWPQKSCCLHCPCSPLAHMVCQKKAQCHGRCPCTIWGVLQSCLLCFTSRFFGASHLLSCFLHLQSLFGSCFLYISMRAHSRPSPSPGNNRTRGFCIPGSIINLMVT
jgi:hypothetical protein